MDPTIIMPAGTASTCRNSSDNGSLFDYLLVPRRLAPLIEDVKAEHIAPCPPPIVECLARSRRAPSGCGPAECNGPSLCQAPRTRKALSSSGSSMKSGGHKSTMQRRLRPSGTSSPLRRETLTRLSMPGAWASRTLLPSLGRTMHSGPSLLRMPPMKNSEKEPNLKRAKRKRTHAHL